MDPGREGDEGEGLEEKEGVERVERVERVEMNLVVGANEKVLFVVLVLSFSILSITMRARESIDMPLPHLA